MNIRLTLETQSKLAAAFQQAISEVMDQHKHFEVVRMFSVYVMKAGEQSGLLTCGIEGIGTAVDPKVVVEDLLKDIRKKEDQ